MSDIVERLRTASAEFAAISWGEDDSKLTAEAADEIDALRRSNAQLALALREHVSTPACGLGGRRKRRWRR